MELYSPGVAGETQGLCVCGGKCCTTGFSIYIALVLIFGVFVVVLLLELNFLFTIPKVPQVSMFLWSIVVFHHSRALEGPCLDTTRSFHSRQTDWLCWKLTELHVVL